MTLASLLIHSLVVSRYSAGAKDDRGNVAPVFADQAAVAGRVQFQAGTEVKGAEDTAVVDWLGFFLPDVVLDRRDRVKWAAGGREFEVVAVAPRYDASALHHSTAYMREVDD